MDVLGIKSHGRISQLGGRVGLKSGRGAKRLGVVDLRGNANTIAAYLSCVYPHCGESYPYAARCVEGITQMKEGCWRLKLGGRRRIKSKLDSLAGYGLGPYIDFSLPQAPLGLA